MTLRPLLASSLLLIAAAAAAQVGEKNETLLNPNVASRDDLLKVPHFDAKLVDALIEHRPYLSMSKLNAQLSQTLDEEKLKELYTLVWVPIDLNSASREEILMIPGAGKKMAHEFDEYRPYDGLKRFRREIGKYVDEKEIARLEKYVYLRLDLNTATADQFATIPGCGKKMVHEFLEYRPYKDIKQFRREIGKYVDEKEIARLERYVLIADQDAKPDQKD